MADETDRKAGPRMGRMRKASRAIERVLGALETVSGYGTKRSRRTYDKR